MIGRLDLNWLHILLVLYWGDFQYSFFEYLNIFVEFLDGVSASDNSQMNHCSLFTVNAKTVLTLVALDANN